MLEIPFTAIGFSHDVNPADCTNTGPACFSCPCYDSCDHHFEELEA